MQSRAIKDTRKVSKNKPGRIHFRTFQGDQVLETIRRIPEGYIDIGLLAKCWEMDEGELADRIQPLIEQGLVGLSSHFVFDAARITAGQIGLMAPILSPVVPSKDRFNQETVATRLAKRDLKLSREASAAMRSLMVTVEPTGIVVQSELVQMVVEQEALQKLLDLSFLKRLDAYIYDPIRLGGRSIQNIQERARQQMLDQRKLQVEAWLCAQTGQTARKEEFIRKAGNIKVANSLLSKFFIPYIVKVGNKSEEWVRAKAAPPAAAETTAKEAMRASMNAKWRACVDLCGDVLRPGASQAKSDRLFVVARTHTMASAAKRLELPEKALQGAVRNNSLPSFVDPDARVRIPAIAVEEAVQEADQWEQVAGYTPLRVRQISLVSGVAYSTARSRLKRAGLSTTDPLWKDVRGRWNLPTSLKAFNSIYQERFPAWLKGVLEKKNGVAWRSAEIGRTFQEKAALEMERLREKLLEGFPTWDSDVRASQQVTLHIGPTNSGKTFEALNELVNAGSGWYLSPLRLLAYEVFDTLNKRGMPCNLLTGEESIPMEGATITAATIEMFNPGRSGNCVIIDEAHMLSDAQRGWAWTRAIMEARSPLIHIIGAPFIEPLVIRLMISVGMEVEKVDHARLTPLQVVSAPWSLWSLPPRTILVAFSRAMVLGLKNELERTHNRRVSVVYGNLPPEVRLSQAERFASGDTEICVATDAVGMGLNLPADNVCFFETEKFDGRQRRTLTPNEIRQIGGRAGRFGLSEFGQVGALTQEDLAVVDKAINNPISEYCFAHVAPTPEALGLIPGKLVEKLQKWVRLQTIPAKWKSILRPVDLSEQIELANMLSQNEVNRLGEVRAFKLINAPTYQETENYWLLCARSIIHGKVMPVPPGPRTDEIKNAEDLKSYEQAIRSADCYLWLSQREEFFQCAPESESVRAWRAKWSREVDAALQRKVDTARRCRSCGRPLALKFRYNICERCYQSRLDDYLFEPVDSDW